MNKPTYKAIAYEHSKGEEYQMGEGIAFSNSIKQAIKSAKHKAFNALRDAEMEAEDPGTSILATVEVYRGLEKVYYESY